MKKKIRIGTRGSNLALYQAHLVRDNITKIRKDINKDQIEIVSIKTTGDKILHKTLSDIGGKCLFTKEIEDALLKNEIDIAVHSLKDFTSKLPKGLILKAFLKREDHRDALVSTKAKSIDELKVGAVIGTASCRRKAQILNIRSDLEVRSLRGNVNTRVKKMLDGEYDAILLAMAGLNRLDFDKNIYKPISIEQMLPAPGQGVICVECREEDEFSMDICAAINHLETEQQMKAERGFLEALDANCATPMAAYATLDGDMVSLEGHVYSLDGKEKYCLVGKSKVSDSYKLGYEFGTKLKKNI